MKITRKLVDNIHGAAFALMVGGALCVEGLVDSAGGIAAAVLLVVAVAVLTVLGEWLGRELDRQERRGRR